jgi:hypothetical protein
MAVLVEQAHAEFGGDNCSVSISKIRSCQYPTWFVHARSPHLCAHGATFEEAMGEFRRQHGNKTPAELANDLREQAAKMLKEADSMEHATT